MGLKADLAAALQASNSVTAQQKQRVAVALGIDMNLKDAQGNPRNANLQEVCGWMLTMLKNRVIHVEQEQAKKAISEPAALPIEE